MANILKQKSRRWLRGAILSGCALLSTHSFATDLEPDTQQDWDVKFQATTVFQRKGAFQAAYSGPNSLMTQREQSHSTTATVFAGFRPWAGGELFFNPEMSLGVPFSNLTGLAGFTNGELAKTSGANPVFYRARLFARQTWDLGNETEAQESDQNQLAGRVGRERLVLTVGNISVLDVFDDNSFSHEPRRQFLNWTIMTHGAWDYPADARGYTWGAAAEYIRPDWAIRAGRFIQPRESNGLTLNPRIFQSYGDALEFEYGYSLAELPGKIRLLAFRNASRMASYQAAIDAARGTGMPPSLSAIRAPRSKSGFGINLEQSVAKSVGIFARLSHADGKTETYAFTEADDSVSGGVVAKGMAWQRPRDEAGIAIAQNRISTSHREYLREGGVGVFLGDGNLAYRPEQIVEAYYSMAVTPNLWASLGAQRITNPGYNAARGPASFGGLRLHVEF
jgi:hypothetical protein